MLRAATRSLDEKGFCVDENMYYYGYIAEKYFPTDTKYPTRPPIKPKPLPVPPEPPDPPSVSLSQPTVSLNKNFFSAKPPIPNVNPSHDQQTFFSVKTQYKILEDGIISVETAQKGILRAHNWFQEHNIIEGLCYPDKLVLIKELYDIFG